MLSQRYDNDGKSILKLSKLQLRMKRQVEKKIKDGIYEFEDVLCPVCDGNDFELLAKKDRYGLYLPVVICLGCGLIQTNPRMNQKAYNEFYNIEYRNLYSDNKSSTDDFFRRQYKRGNRLYKFIETTGFFKNRENMVVFEIGCGAGGILHYFREMGCCVKGVDLGESYIDYGRNQYNLDLSVGSIDSIYDGESPDLIIYSHVLEHILTPNEELQSARNMLSDTGILYIEIPSVKNLTQSYEMDFLRLLQNAHTYHFTQKSLQNLLTRNGFDLIKGDETVRSVFKKAKGQGSSGEPENDYSDVIAYVHKIERYRPFYPISPHKLKKLPKALVINVLKAIGLFEPVRHLYRSKKTVKLIKN